MAKREAGERKASRRSNGEGCISLRKDGRWSAIVTIGRGADGKQIRRTVYGKTKREVDAKLTRMKGHKLDGKLGAPAKMTVSALLQRWLDDSARASVRRLTLKGYRILVRKHIEPRIGGIQLDALTPLNVQGLYTALAKDGASGRKQQLVHAILHKALKTAVKWRLIFTNPASSDCVERPTAPRKEIRPLTAEEAQKFLQAAKGDRLEALYVLALAAGMRQGELFGLKRSDIDMASGVISVQRTLNEDGQEFFEGEPKSRKGRRSIQLPPFAVQALHDHFARMLREGNAGATYVFCAPEGGPLRRHNFRKRSYLPLLKKAGVPTVRFHDLRHSCASLLLSLGVHPKVVQELLGHATIAITMDTYSHVAPSLQGEATAKLGGLLAPTGT